ncbi:SCO0930 family lipoprotein [Streptomyces sp. NPDC017991]|uniref:SCO0930 family lipoprotein n=1 Tax=Streptomyces sp. NPDC017991 TaxID=3365026 RepID=UPI0037B228B3
MATWRSRTVALTAAAIMLTAGCGGSGSGGKADKAAPSAPAAQESLAGAAPAADSRSGPAGQLTLADDPNLGTIVSDATGFTLYRFTKDSANPAVSACSAACAKVWPPVPSDSVTLPTGIDAALMGSVKRADGISQLTLAGLPLYRYAKDAKPGQISGDGIDGAWFASLPENTIPSPDEAAGGSPDTAGAGGDTTGGTGATGESETTADQPGLSVAQDPELGAIVVDAKGRTLYRFTKDTDWPMTTACTGACLEKWKPAALVGKNDVEGIASKLVIPFNRPDGIKQQTLDCWPLYWFTGDKQPGDTDGQGVGGTWFAVAADGSLVKS